MSTNDWCHDAMSCVVPRPIAPLSARTWCLRVVTQDVLDHLTELQALEAEHAVHSPRSGRPPASDAGGIAALGLKPATAVA
jgi:hypothetical protein